MLIFCGSRYGSQLSEATNNAMGAAGYALQVKKHNKKMIFWLFTALEQAKKSIMLYSTFSFFCFLADVVECGQHRDQVSMRKAPQRLGNVLQRFDTSQARQRVIAASVARTT